MTNAIPFQLTPVSRTLRKEPYQHQWDAINAILAALKSDVNSVPYAYLCTSFGKSLCAAVIAEKGYYAGRRVLILVPSEELVHQNYNELIEYIPNSSPNVGICCGGNTKKYQISRQIVIAMASSIVNKIYKAGKFDLVIIDECDLVSPKEGTRYQKIDKGVSHNNPKVRRCGFTGSPWREDLGMIHEMSGKHKPFFTQMVYESNMTELMELGFLSKIKDISGDIHADMDNVPLSGKDYDTSIMGARFDAIMPHAVADIKLKYKAYGIKTSIIYVSTVDNAIKVMEEWGDPSTIRMIVGDKKKMPPIVRKANVDWLQYGEGERHIVNVGVLSRGFSYSELHCVTFLRATQSPNLYVQIIGRVVRPHESKEHGYFLDYGENAKRHGAVNEISIKAKTEGGGDAPYRKCGECGEHNNVRAVACQACGHIFPEPETGNYSMRSNAQVINQPLTYNIASTDWKIETKGFGKAGITHQFYGEKGGLIHEEHLRLDNDNGAEKHAQAHILRMMKDPMVYFKNLMQMEGGVSVRNVSLLFEEYEDFFKPVSSITIAQEGKYPRMISMELQNE